ncbi:MAG: DUF3500 domain-containing protein [Bacteroidota bacterium]
MKILLLTLTLLSSTQLSILSAQDIPQLNSYAKALMTSMSELQKKQACFSFDDKKREKWSNLPVGLIDRAGVRYGDLSNQSRIHFHMMLSTILSSQGYLKITSIMQMEKVLNGLIDLAYKEGLMNDKQRKRLEDLEWDYGNYFLSIWGKPSDKTPWGFNFGGHHMAINFTIVEGKISVSPFFLGSDPGQVKDGPYAGLRILSKEEDYGFMLLQFLSEEQKEQAIIEEDVPQDIITNPNAPQRIDEYYGVPVSSFNEDQRYILKMLITEYAHNFEHTTAHKFMNMLEEGGMDKLYFSWIGSQEKGAPHYYLINGPDFMIEYDNYPSKGNHVHLILRDKRNHFGEDLLKDHYQNHPHHKKKGNK